MSKFLNWKNSVFLLLTFLVQLNVVYGQCPDCPVSKVYTGAPVVPNGNTSSLWQNVPGPGTGTPTSSDIVRFTGDTDYTWVPSSPTTIKGLVVEGDANLTLDRNSQGTTPAFIIQGASESDKGCIVVRSGSTLNLIYISNLVNVNICVEEGGRIVFDARDPTRNDYLFNGVDINLQGPGAIIEFGDADINLGIGGLNITGYTGTGCIEDSNGDYVLPSPPPNIFADPDVTNVYQFCLFLASAGFGILPVEYVYFNAELQNKRAVKLSWATATEYDNSHFEIFRAVNNLNKWQKIGIVPGRGFSETIEEYAFEDENLPLSGGNVFYRLKQVDNSGDFGFSKVVSARVPQLSEFKGVWKVYPNPTDGYEFNFELVDRSKYKDEPIQVRLSGPIATQAVFTSKDLNVLTSKLKQVLQRSKKGVYILQVTWGQNIEHIKILKQ
jgi:hypothetical protein